MKNMQKILAVSMAMVTVVLLGAPIASGQTVANLVDAVLKEAEVRDWKWGDGGRYEHPTRPQADVVLAQCLQEALGRGEYPEIEAAFMANKAYVEKSIPKAIAFAHEEWNPLESTFITFQLMIRGVDPEAQLRGFNAWVKEWGEALGDDVSGLEVSGIDFSAQGAVEELFDACLELSNAKFRANAASFQGQHEIEHACEKIVYTFLRLFERDHAKTADLFTEDASVPFPAGGGTVGREAIREFFSTVDARDVELNVLTANNLVITVIDENNAEGSFYMTHRQHIYEDSKREGQGVLSEPITVTRWSWDFKRVEGEWKIASMKGDLTLLTERFVGALSE